MQPCMRATSTDKGSQENCVCSSLDISWKNKKKRCPRYHTLSYDILIGRPIIIAQPTERLHLGVPQDPGDQKLVLHVSQPPPLDPWMGNLTQFKCGIRYSDESKLIFTI